MKTAELIDTALDWAVSECNYVTCCFDHKGRLMEERGDLSWVYAPSTIWSQGGPIIEREGITVSQGSPVKGLEWMACDRGSSCIQHGPTYLIAAMRCYVASKLGEEIEIPEELQNAN